MYVFLKYYQRDNFNWKVPSIIFFPSFFQQHEAEVQQNIADTQAQSINGNNACNTFKQSSNNNLAPHKYSVSCGLKSFRLNNIISTFYSQKYNGFLLSLLLLLSFFLGFSFLIFYFLIRIGVLAAIASFQRPISKAQRHKL